MTLGNKIVELRKKRNLTQEQLSEKLGITNFIKLGKKHYES